MQDSIGAGARYIVHGDIFELSTSDPEKRPLPHIYFFQVRYAMQHIFAGIKAAGAPQAIFGDDPPDDNTPGSVRDETFLPTDWDDMLREALELGILNSIQVSQPTKTGSGTCSLKEKEKEERLLIKQSKHDDGYEEQKGMPEGREKGKQKISISTDKDKGTDHSEGEALMLTPKLSKLSLKGSYRRLKEVPGKFKRSRVASLFHKPKEEERVGEQEL
ncbi:hypothetical protein B0T26DRAFT_679129 [Lasiosphaeria miniovina]|uniref:Uncharacterized protein n=1 Tax=Lasiosphaeria miniovina TaxID=1954250 RepID=A0AA40DRX9_9PEZI|nr:uncharacterized protein B0T26DRAFT_679129 [Lasiosphaeria miniovina]KAK0709758.1 hypothetical protein B0T26DRAFT_679129 [Lasiosphaeria miniovina]